MLKLKESETYKVILGERIKESAKKKVLKIAKELLKRHEH